MFKSISIGLLLPVGTIVMSATLVEEVSGVKVSFISVGNYHALLLSCFVLSPGRRDIFVGAYSVQRHLSISDVDTEAH